MKSRIHLADSAEPLTELTAITALCGVEIPNAIYVMMGDQEFAPLGFNAIDIYEVIKNLRGLCSHCSDMEIKGRYVYAIRAGQEALNGQAKVNDVEIQQ